MQPMYYVSLVALLATKIQAWEVTTYDAVEDCDPTDTTTYRIFDGQGDSLGVCQEVAGAPAAGISCREYLNGGISNNDCGDRGDGALHAKSVLLNDTTDGYADGNIFCQFFATAGCKNADGSPQVQCFNPFGTGAVSFMCVQNGEPPA